jgi:hypothetical protein
MKTGTPDHPKARALRRRLARLLSEQHGLDRPVADALALPLAAGFLELLWHFTAARAPRGDVGRFRDADIAEAVGWPWDPAELVAAMSDPEAAWLDPSRRHRLVVHDWSKHAERGVHVALARRGECFADGKPPDVTRLSKEERSKLPPLKRAHNRRTVCAPPSPSPTPITDTPPTPRKRGGRSHGGVDVLASLATALGMPSGRPERRAWREALEGGSTVEAMGAALRSEAVRRQGAAAGQEQLSTAGAWVRARGGDEAVALELAAWLETHQAAGELPAFAAERWAQQAEAPSGVYGIVARIVMRIRRENS